MNILITGGAGYVGTELAHILVEDARVDQVVIYDNLSRNNYNLFLEKSFNNKKIIFFKGDILDGRRLEKALKNIDVVFHLAAKVTTPYTDQELHQYEQVNHWGTAELVSKISTSNVKHLIYLSSAAVYGFGDELFTEESAIQPANNYGITKYRAEKEINLLKDQLKTTIIRSANVFGYSRTMRFDSVINRFMFDANFNGKINVYGDGRQYRPFVSISYLTKLLAYQLFDENFPALINAFEFNYTLNEVIFEYLKLLYPDIDILYINQELPVQGIQLSSRYNDSLFQQLKDGSLTEILTKFKSKFSF